MLEVIAVQELGCIRYCGSQPRILGALATSGEQRQADHSAAPSLLSRLRLWLAGQLR